MTGFDSRRVSWVTLREQAMNKRTGALSLADWISFDTRLFLPLSLDNPAHYTVLSLQCQPGGCRAAKKTVSMVSQHQALTSTSVPGFTSWWSLERSASTLVLSTRHWLTGSNKWTCPRISGTRQPRLSKLYKSNSTVKVYVMFSYPMLCRFSSCRTYRLLLFCSCAIWWKKI